LPALPALHAAFSSTANSLQLAINCTTPNVRSTKSQRSCCWGLCFSKRQMLHLTHTTAPPLLHCWCLVYKNFADSTDNSAKLKHQIKQRTHMRACLLRVSNPSVLHTFMHSHFHNAKQTTSCCTKPHCHQTKPHRTPWHCPPFHRTPKLRHAGLPTHWDQPSRWLFIWERKGRRACTQHTTCQNKL
jgi:hypothetical protein